MTKQGTPLRNYIKNHINVSTYFEMVEQIINMLKKVQGEGIQLILDIDQMKMVDKQIHFQLVTEESIYEGEQIKKFLKEFTFCCVFAYGENCTGVSEFLRYLDLSWDGLDLTKIKEYITGRNGIESSVRSEQQEPQNNMPLNGETGVLDVTYWEDLQKQYIGQDNNGETGVLDPSFWNDALRNTPSQKLGGVLRTTPVAKLVHSTSGREVIINKASFWIGKEGVDLVIDKDVISRKHAELITRGNSYFIMDNNSTNKTYVDGKAIAPKASVEIYNGTKIKFVDEEYKFCIVKDVL